MKKHYPALDSSQVDLTSMIDIVFLLLVFFMVSTQLIKQEADIGIQLPQPRPTSELPTKHVVDILPDGTLLLNGGEITTATGDELVALSQMLQQLKHSADRLNHLTFITIQADPYSARQRSVEVLNACADAELKYVSFSRI